MKGLISTLNMTSSRAIWSVEKHGLADRRLKQADIERDKIKPDVDSHRDNVQCALRNATRSGSSCTVSTGGQFLPFSFLSSIFVLGVPNLNVETSAARIGTDKLRKKRYFGDLFVFHFSILFI